MKQSAVELAELVSLHEREILEEWLKLLKAGGALQTGRIKEAELDTQCRAFLAQMRAALQGGGSGDKPSEAYDILRNMVGELSASRAIQGFSPFETAMFVFSLKQPLFTAISKATQNDAAKTAMVWQSTLLLDELGIYVMEVFQKTREQVIARQSREIAELSTPVVKLWEGILALPVIGTLDSERTQMVMENLLQSIVDESAEIAIHRHHRRTDGGHAGGAASAEDGGGRAADGRRLHHLRHSPPDCPDDGAPRGRTECRIQVQSRRRFRDGFDATE